MLRSLALFVLISVFIRGTVVDAAHALGHSLREPVPHPFAGVMTVGALAVPRVQRTQPTALDNSPVRKGAKLQFRAEVFNIQSSGIRSAKHGYRLLNRGEYIKSGKFAPRHPTRAKTSFRRGPREICT